MKTNPRPYFIVVTVILNGNPYNNVLHGKYATPESAIERARQAIQMRKHRFEMEFTALVKHDLEGTVWDSEKSGT